MKFKRTLSIIIALMLVIVTGTTAFAEEKSVNTAMTSIDESTVKVSKEEAKSIAQKALKNLMDTEIDENKAQFRA